MKKEKKKQISNFPQLLINCGKHWLLKTERSKTSLFHVKQAFFLYLNKKNAGETKKFLRLPDGMIIDNNQRTRSIPTYALYKTSLFLSLQNFIFHQNFPMQLYQIRQRNLEHRY